MDTKSLVSDIEISKSKCRIFGCFVVFMIFMMRGLALMWRTKCPTDSRSYFAHHINVQTWEVMT